MNGEPLPLEHGFPVRMVVPGLYGYVSATKWLVDLEVTRFADFKAYWSTRGYSVKAPIKTSSRIDVPQLLRAGEGRHEGPGRRRRLVAGPRHQDGRGPRRRRPLAGGRRSPTQDNIDTWRQWVWMWEPKSGNHTIEVRATDDTGYTQTDKRVPIAPNGSTGWHSVNVTAS